MSFMSTYTCRCGKKTFTGTEGSDSTDKICGCNSNSGLIASGKFSIIGNSEIEDSAGDSCCGGNCSCNS